MLLPRKMLDLERQEDLGGVFSWALYWSGSTHKVCLLPQSPCRTARGLRRWKAG